MKKWAEEIFPGIYIIGHEASDTDGEQAVLIDKDDHTYLVFTEGFAYGSWVGERYKLTPEGREKVMNWEGDTYELRKLLGSQTYQCKYKYNDPCTQ